MATKTTKKRNVLNPLEAFEAIGDTGRSIVKSVGEDVNKNLVIPAGFDFMNQLLNWDVHPGGDKGKKDGHAPEHKPENDKLKFGGIEMIPGIPVILFDAKATAKKEDPKAHERAVDQMKLRLHHEQTDKVVRGSEHVSAKEKHEMRRTVDEIRAELTRLVSSSQVLEQEFAHVAMEPTPVTPGKYHVNFFEWVLVMIRQARMKVEDGGAWMAAMGSKGKGKGKGFMQDQWKQGNTSTTMSNERAVATQTG